jgi:photosystem II stability/assembly factor-like uncharacterized protein
VDADLGGRRVHALLAVPDNAGVLLAGTSDGLFRSEDEGRSWRMVPNLPTPIVLTAEARDRGRQIYSLAAGPDGVLYLAGAGAQPWRSTDAGRTWSPLTRLPAGGAVLALAMASDGRRLLAGSDGAGLFRSDDGGHTWQAVADIPATYVAGLWFDPQDGRLVYARTRAGLYRSHDGGFTWQRSAVALSGRLDALVPGPGPGQALVLANDGRVYSSDDGGHSWQWQGSLARSGVVLTAQHHPADGSILVGHQTGLWRSTDEGRTWQNRPMTPGRPRLYDLIQTADGMLYLATSAGLFRTTDPTGGWEAVTMDLPTATALTIAAAADASLLYAGFEGHGLYRSTDGGRRWSATTLEVPDPVGVLVHPREPGHVWVRAAFQRPYESRDAGATWRTPWEGLDLSTELMALAWVPADPPLLVAAGTEQLYRRVGDEPWQAIAPLLAGQTVFTLVADPVQPSHLLVGATRGVYRSTDAGLTWEAWGRGLEEVTVTALLVVPGRTRTLLAGTKYHGLFRSDDGGRTWRPLGLEGRSIVRLLITTDHRHLLAATDDGLWRASWAEER